MGEEGEGVTNQEKLDEHQRNLAFCKNGGLLKLMPSIYTRESLKYSDDAELRKVAVVIEYADYLYMQKVLEPYNPVSPKESDNE